MWLAVAARSLHCGRNFVEGVLDFSDFVVDAFGLLDLFGELVELVDDLLLKVAVPVIPTEKVNSLGC